MKRRNKFVLTLIFSLIPVLFFGWRSYIPAAIADSEIYHELNRFMEVCKVVKQYYVEDVNIDKLITGAINGMLEQLDPHSIYIEPNRLEKVNEEFDGYFLGIGIEFIIQNKVLTVVAPIAGTPSERLGIRPGDQIIKINGAYTYGISEDEVKEKLRGKRGSTVTVTIKRPGIEPAFDLVITRDRIPIYSVMACFMLDNRTGYIALSRFARTTANELDKAMADLKRQGMQQLLLDLRSNSGGYLDQAVAVVDRFIPAGNNIVFTRGRILGADETFKSTSFTPYKDLPLIVLINSGSASASEIVAGAIQDWDRGLIVGETSFGKGLVQSQIELNDQSALRITIARYYTPSGRLIQRPYQNGIAEYYMASIEDNQDSGYASQPDSLAKAEVFWTSKGRKVYGGGGIRPDIIIRSGLITPFTSLLLSKRLFFEFASQYASHHPVLGNDFAFFQRHFKVDSPIIKNFKAFITDLGIEIKNDEMAKDLDYIKLLVKSEIGRNLWNSEKYYQLFVQGDYQVQEAIKLFPKSIQLAGLSLLKKNR